MLNGTVKIGSSVAANPLVSIIIPNYNTARYIADTLESVFAQTFTDYEVIVINDASPDTQDLLNVLEPYIKRITFINKRANDGTSATRNLAAGFARGERLVFLDADDILLPTFLHELCSFRDTYSFDMVYADCSTFTNRSKKMTSLMHTNPEQGEITRQMLIDGKCHILPSGSLIMKAAFDSVEGFDPKVSRTEDLDLWMRMLFSGIRIGYLRKLLFLFRISPHSGSGNAVVRIQRTVTCWRTLQKKLDFTDEENKMIEHHVADYEAAAMRALGRDQIYRKDWAGAKGSFKKALERSSGLGLSWTHRLKIRMVILLLGISPSILLLLYRRFRSSEIEYLPTNV